MSTMVVAALKACGTVSAEMLWPNTSHMWACELVLARVTPKGLFRSPAGGNGTCVAAIFEDGSWTTLSCRAVADQMRAGRLRVWERSEIEAAEAMCALQAAACHSVGM